MRLLYTVCYVVSKISYPNGITILIHGNKEMNLNECDLKGLKSTSIGL